MFTRSSSWLGLAPALACTFFASAATIDVPADHPTVQDAVDAAVDGDVVRIADGTWSNVQVIGKSITLRSASGDAADCVLFGGSPSLLLFGGGACVVQDLTLKGSRGLGVEAGSSAVVERCQIQGSSTGGVFFNSTALTMRDCIVFSSTTPNAGAAILFTSGDLTLIDCVFDDNQVTGPVTQGGAVYSSDAGGAVLITGCLFVDNRAEGATTGRGGGLHLERKTDVTIVDTEFRANRTSGEGAGVYLDLTSASFMNCRFRQNVSGGGGGGIWIDNGGGAPNLVTMTNCLLDRNQANGGSGGGIRQLSNANLALGNCTVARNESSGGGSGIANAGGSTVVLTNCIVGGNTNGQIAGAGIETASYSNIQGGLPGAGNIDVDPQWIDPVGGNYRLEPTSPSIDAGNTIAYVGLPVDLDGNARLVNAPGMPDTGIAVAGDTIDMGCYEYAEPDVTCAGDVDGDGAIGFNDLLAVLSAWGPCP